MQDDREQVEMAAKRAQELAAYNAPAARLKRCLMKVFCPCIPQYGRAGIVLEGVDDAVGRAKN